MTAHLFGGTWSSSACPFALHQTANDLVTSTQCRKGETILKNFHVDDCLKSVDKLDEVKQLAEELREREMLKEGGFLTHKMNQ